MNSEL